MSHSPIVYRGRHDGAVFRNGVRLDPRLDLRNHSPTGFSWGYSGSGPAQLALALIADATGDDELALRVYQRFKARHIVHWPQGLPWRMTAGQVRARARELDEAAENVA